MASAVDGPIGSQNENCREREGHDVAENLESFVALESFCVAMIEPAHPRGSGAMTGLAVSQ